MQRLSVSQWFRNHVVPATPASGAVMYGDADTIKVRQANGTIFTLGPPSVFPLFVQDAAPGGTLPSQYVWVQTNMGVSGEDFAFWVEDGDA